MDEPILKKAILEFLCKESKSKKSFSSRQIAEKIAKKYPKKYGGEKKELKQLIGEVSCMLTRDITDPQLEIITDPKPQRYRWVKKGTEITEEESETQDGEKDLYEPLIEYLKQEWRMHAKPIDHEKSTKREDANNKWLHPDIVGVEILDSNWEEETKVLADVFNRNRKRARLWSFEVKKGKISRSNARLCFFQAVANSSWANFGYLVAEEIKDIGTKKELRTLADLYGIGVIIFVKGEPDNSYVLIPAHERPEVDWAACNPLAEVNGDFREFMEDATKRMTPPNKEIQLEALDGKREHEASEKKEEKAPTQSNQVNYNFWKKVLDYFHEKQLGLYKNTKSPSRGDWVGPSSGANGCIYVCRKRPRQVQVEFYINKKEWTKEKTEEIFDFLHERKEEIEGRFGEKLEWDRAEGWKRCRIYLSKSVQNYDSEEQEIIDWLYDRTQKLEKAFAPLVNDIRQIINEY